MEAITRGTYLIGYKPKPKRIHWFPNLQEDILLIGSQAKKNKFTPGWGLYAALI